MTNNEDWLNDPLMKIEYSKGIFTYLPTNKVNKEVWDTWTSYHFTTRLKVNGADYFLRQLYGLITRPDQLGLPELAFNLRHWYLDAFFFELMSAYDVLIQELNVIYECGVDSDDPRILHKVKKKLPNDLCTIIEDERQTDWFKRLQEYRNTVSHRHRILSSSSFGTWVGKKWRYEGANDTIWYFDKESGELKYEDSKECRSYFDNMIDYIHKIWTVMKEQRF
jgi:hypothetical protein